MNMILYYAVCQEESCPYDYVGESDRRMLERVKDHDGRDTSYHILKHCVAADHQFVSCDDLSIVGRSYRNKKRKRKTAEALSIKNLKTSLRWLAWLKKIVFFMEWSYYNLIMLIK